MPILPALVVAADPGPDGERAVTPAILEELVDTTTLCYTGLYDGLLVVNPATLFAVRFCAPQVAYLTPLLHQRVSLTQFLALRTVESRLMDVSRPTVDPQSRDWWTVGVPALGHEVFGARHGPLMSQIVWQTDNVGVWLFV